MTVHELKLQQPHFDDVWNGLKDFEVRKNDRNYKVGDRLKLIEFPFVGRQRFIIKEVKYILKGGDYGIDKDFVVLGLEDFKPCFNQIPDTINTIKLNNPLQNNPLQHLSDRVDFKAHLERLKQNKHR